MRHEGYDDYEFNCRAVDGSCTSANIRGYAAIRLIRAIIADNSPQFWQFIPHVGR